VIPAWQLALSFAIALSIGAGVGIAVEELRWMRRRGRLTRAAVREMRLSLSSLPPNVVVSIALFTSLIVSEPVVVRFSTVTQPCPALHQADGCAGVSPAPFQLPPAMRHQLPSPSLDSSVS